MPLTDVLEMLGEIDLAFVIDTTGSMGAYIHEAQVYAAAEAERIAADKDLNIRFAVVEYRDHPPEELSFVTRVYPFGDSAALKQALSQLMPTGGGDEPEAVWDGLAAAGNLQWRPTADHLCFLIGDAPPHGYAQILGTVPFGDHWPEGCPCGITAGGIVELFGHRRITLNAHSIAGIDATTKAFTEVAEATGGKCSVVDRPEASTVAYAATMEARGDIISSSRAVASASASMDMSHMTDAEAVDHILEVSGLTPEQLEEVRTYSARRGVHIDLGMDRAGHTLDENT